MKHKNPVIFSGIQPTGNLHLGNYLGAVKNWVELQNSGKYDCYFCVVDYHSLTGNMKPEDRRQQIYETAAELLACGIDPDKSTFFIQSQVPEHTELSWIFNCVTPITELYRMTQFKDKSARQEKNINSGLLTYPVLQAADILIYMGELVPVGEDQVQHIELTRDVARWFNNRYGDFFPETKHLLTEVPRVMSLLEPEKKMSKSLGLGHVIELREEPEEIVKKLKRAVTATEGGGDSPGVTNLLGLLKIFAPKAKYEEFLVAEKNMTIQYGQLKSELGLALADHFAVFRQRRKELSAHPEHLQKILEAGGEKARQVASQTMNEVRKLVGIR